MKPLYKISEPMIKLTMKIVITTQETSQTQSSQIKNYMNPCHITVEENSSINYKMVCN